MRASMLSLPSLLLLATIIALRQWNSFVSLPQKCLISSSTVFFAQYQRKNQVQTTPAVLERVAAAAAPSAAVSVVDTGLQTDFQR